MVTHLKGKHEKEFKSYEERKSALAKSTTGTPASSSKQLTLEQAFNPVKFWDIEDKRAMKLHYAVAEMIAVDNLPISHVENEGFRRVMAKTQPHYQVH